MMKEKKVDVETLKNCVRFYGHPYVAMQLGVPQEDRSLSQKAFIIRQNQDHEQEMKLRSVGEFKELIVATIKALNLQQIQYRILEKKTAHLPHQNTYCLIDPQTIDDQETVLFIQGLKSKFAIQSFEEHCREIQSEISSLGSKGDKK